MKFEFAHYTEITDLAFKINPEYKNESYIRFFICPDVSDTWFVRILKGYNEEYKVEEGSYILERNKIENHKKGQKLTLDRVKHIIEDDDGSNWDIQSSYHLDELIDMLGAGFEILNLRENNDGESK